MGARQAPPNIVVREWQILRERAATPLNDVASGKARQLSNSLLTLDAVSHQVCAGVGRRNPPINLVVQNYARRGASGVLSPPMHRMHSSTGAMDSATLPTLPAAPPRPRSLSTNSRCCEPTRSTTTGIVRTKESTRTSRWVTWAVLYSRSARPATGTTALARCECAGEIAWAVSSMSTS